MENRIRVMVFEPLREPHIEYIKNEKEAYESIVGGDYTDQQLDKNTVVVYNTDDKALELMPNRGIGNDIICGTFFIASEADVGKYASLTDGQIQYYYGLLHEPEVISQQEVKENLAFGLNGIGRNAVYINNLNLQFGEDKIDIEKVVSSYKTEDKTEAKKLLKTMVEVFKETHDVMSVDEMVDDGEDFMYLPSIIKGSESGELCIGLVLVDLSSSGEPHGAQFLLYNGFYDEYDKNMPEDAKKARAAIGNYDHWYPLDYSGDIHVDFDNVPEDVQSMLDYAKGIEEQAQGMNMNSI